MRAWLLFCVVAGCAQAAAPPSARVIALARPARRAPAASGELARGAGAVAAATSPAGVSLEPAPSGQYEIWRLRNGGSAAIAPRASGRAATQSSAFSGHFERFSPESEWVGVERGTECLSVGAAVDALPSGASRLVGELAPLGAREPLAPGRYRFVVGYHEDDRPDLGWEARAPFEVQALDEHEALELFDALAKPELRACPGAFAQELHAFVASAPPSHLPRLLDLPARSLDERLLVLRALGGFRDLRRLFGWAISASDVALSIAASVVVTESAWCTDEAALCEAAMARLLASPGRSRPIDVPTVEALARVPERWPAGAADKLVAALEAGPPDTARAALAAALLAAGAARLDGKAASAIRSLRRSAEQTHDATTRATLTGAAAELESGHSHPSGPPPAPATVEEACAPLVSSLGRLTRFVGARSVPMTVTHAGSSVESAPR